MTQKKANNAKHSKTKLPWFSRLYDIPPGNEVGLFYDAPEPTWHYKKERACQSSSEPLLQTYLQLWETTIAGCRWSVAC